MDKSIMKILTKITAIEKEQKKTNCFVEDMPRFAISHNLSAQNSSRVLSNYFFRNKDIYISKHNRFADYPEHTHIFLEMLILFEIMNKH